MAWKATLTARRRIPAGGRASTFKVPPIQTVEVNQLIAQYEFAADVKVTRWKISGQSVELISQETPRGVQFIEEQGLTFADLQTAGLPAVIFLVTFIFAGVLITGEYSISAIERTGDAITDAFDGIENTLIGKIMIAVVIGLAASFIIKRIQS